MMIRLNPYRYLSQYILFFVFLIYSIEIFSSSLTVATLPTAPVENNPVCYDSISGKLGNCPSLELKGRVVWVATDGTGDFVDPVRAMDNLAEWCQTPTERNPCLIRITPGEYILAEALIMQDYVHIKGAGKEVTILARTSNDFGESSGVVIGANAILSSLSIEAKADITAIAGANIVGIYHPQSVSHLNIENVYIRSEGLSGVGNVFALKMVDNTVTILNSLFVVMTGAFGRGIIADDGNILLNSTKLKLVGVFTSSKLAILATNHSKLFIDNSVLNTGIQMNDSFLTMKFSEMNDGFVIGTGTGSTSCLASIFDGVFSENTCP